MIAFVSRRAGQMLVVLLIMSFVVYALIGLMPGDPIDLMLAGNPGATPEVVAKLREVYGLDQPLITRYFHWLAAALGGDFGFSRVHSQPVMVVLAPAIAQSAKLMLSAFLLSVVIAFVLGTLAALRRGGWVDTCVGIFTFAGISIPVFWLALLLILLFAVKLQWLPAGGTDTYQNSGVIDQIRHMALPVVTLALANAGQFTRYVRAAVIETLHMDFVRTARAKGVSEPRIAIAHVLRNAMIPVVTMMALNFGTLFSGALITETMFAQPGMGKLIYTSVLGNDFNLALVGLLFATLIALVSNFVADIAYGLLDPRISLR